MKHVVKVALFVLMAVIVVAMMVVPSFAFTYNFLNVTIVDVNSTSTRSVSIPIDLPVDQILVYYDSTDSSIYINLGIMDDTSTYFVTYMPSVFDCNVTISSKNLSTGIISPSNDQTSVTGSFSSDGNYVNVTLEMSTNTVYTTDQLEIYGSDQYQLGYNAGKEAMEQLISANPQQYGYRTLSDYQNYGQSMYNEGKKAGIASVSTDDRYEEGLHDGIQQGRSLVGLANVGITGIATVFNNFVGQVGIFGVSLGAVIVTGVIILIVFLIFKAIRS